MEKRLYEKQEIYDPATIAELSEHYAAILRLLGEDPTREGLLKTPERVAKAMAFMTKGYAEDPRDILLSAMFREEYRQMVLVRDIEVYSLCEHHMLPFYGKAHVAYIPDGYITGLSKVARVVECFARRLQVQERLTVQIRDCIHEALHPLGVAVVIEASHMCMQMRGVEKQESSTTTSAFTGIFLRDHRTREEFMELIRYRPADGAAATRAAPSGRSFLNEIRPESFCFRGGFIARRRASQRPQFGNPATHSGRISRRRPVRSLWYRRAGSHPDRAATEFCATSP